MNLGQDFESDESSVSSINFDFESDSDSDAFYYGYSERRRRRFRNNYISLPDLKAQYNADMAMNKKILLFLNAAHENDIPFLRRLLSDGVSVDCVGVDGWTALMKACLNGEKQAAEFLLQNGSNPNFQAGLFTSLLACCTYNTAAEEDKLACVNLLLQHGVDVNMCDKHKSTPLMHAASSGYLSIIRALFEVEGLNINKIDTDGWNAVFHAVSNNRFKSVELLVESGVNYKLTDNSGRTPLSLAEEKRFCKIATFLRDLEGDIDIYEEEDEDENNFLENNPFGYFLKELPDADGEGGFTMDTKEVLASHGIRYLKKIPFPVFLNMSEKDLMDWGLKIKSNRTHILKDVIHNYHCHPWAKTSMLPITKGVPMALEEGACITASMAKHLALVRASLRYIMTRIEQRQRKASEDLQVDTIRSLLSTYIANKTMNKKLKNILELQKSVKGIDKEDLITKPQKESNKGKTTFKYGLMIMGATTAGYFIYNNRLKIDGFIKELVYFIQ